MEIIDDEILELRTGQYLNEHERFVIQTDLRAKIPKAHIARKLGRDRRTVEREIKRGLCYQRDSLTWNLRKVYCAEYAQIQADKRATAKGAQIKIGSDHEGEAAIAHLIKEADYSPAAALAKVKRAGQLKQSFCVKTYYNYVEHGYVSIRPQDLPMEGKRKRKARKKYNICQKDPARPSIEQRPKIVMFREIFGHWEGDLVVSPQDGSHECLFTLVERKTRFGIVERFKDKTSKNIVNVIDRLEDYYQEIFGKIFKTITFDNGSENADWRKMQVRSGTLRQRLSVFFAHPYRSCERGTNENYNRFLRRKIPKKTDIASIGQSELKAIVKWVNTYPRKILGYDSAEEAFMQELSYLQVR
jgi:IS30 family transposase